MLSYFDILGCYEEQKKTADPYLQKKEVKRLEHVRCQQRVKIKRKIKIAQKDRQRKNKNLQRFCLNH